MQVNGGDGLGVYVCWLYFMVNGYYFVDGWDAGGN